MQFSTNNILNNNYQIRTEIHQGKRHIVVPVVMLVQGVHEGSGGKILHLSEELAKYPEAWNGIPIPVLHPERNGSPISANEPAVIDSKIVGRVYNTKYTEGKLKAEAWLDEEKIAQISPLALAYIQQGRPLDVSTGLFSDEEETPGVWDGEEYVAIARNYRPDHLALLPGTSGACSWADGCGVRANKGEDMKDIKKQELLAKYIRVNKEGYKERIDRIQNKLNAMDTDIKMYFLVDIWDKYCVYRVVNNAQNTEEHYQRDYKINEDKSIEFTGEPIPVTPRVEYVKNNSSKKEGFMAEKENKNNKQQDKGCCPEEITYLIQSNSSIFEESDREWIQKLPKEAIDKLVANNKTIEAEKEKNIALQTNLDQNKVDNEKMITKEDAIKVLQEQLADPKQFMELLPPQIKEQMQHGLTLHEKRKKELITTITTNSKVYSEKELVEKEVGELEKMVQLITPRTDYSPMSINRQKEDEDVPVLLPKEAEEKNK